MPVRAVSPGALERELTARLETINRRRPARPQKRRKTSRGGRLRFAGVFGVLALMLLSVGGAFATHSLDLFELDGNAVDDALVTGDDWSNIYAGSDSADASVIVDDPYSPDPDAIFTGGASKDHEDISDWQCKTGTAADKNDIEHAFAAAYTIEIDSEEHTVLYFGADKFSTSGDAQIGFWFLKGTAGCTPTTTGSTTAAFSGSHTIGDILLLSDFTNGGNVANITAYSWVGDGNGDVPNNGGPLVKLAEAGDCSIAAPTDPLCASVNPDGNETTGGWEYHQKPNLVGDPPEADDGKYPAGAFYEGGIDLTNFFEGGVECFSTFLAETRQTHEVTAVLDDFAIGNLNTCAPDLSLEKTPDGETHFVGESFDWTIVVTNNGDGDATDAVVTDTIPAGLTINSATTPAGTCDVTGQDVECTIDVAKEGGTATITVNVTATGDAVTDASGCSDLDNEATVTGDEDTSDNTDSGQVTVCELSVEKDATTTFNRDFDWTIEKSADQTSLILTEGQSFLVNYSVTVTPSAPQDSDWAVSGTITITNPASIPADITDITDTISGGFGEVTVDCGGASEVPAEDSLECTYSTSLPNGDNRTNSVDVVAYGTTYNATAAITFGSPTNTTDECVDVSDTLGGALGSVCVGDPAADFTFTYTYDVGQELCGEYDIPNTASFVTNDNAETGSDDWSVHVSIDCDTGCTLTLGYWKTHSEFGPAPEDDAWLDLPDVDGDGTVEGPNETFFLSGQTWYEVFWTAPKGNAYYNLAQQYMAAILNGVNGADTTSVDAAIAGAEALFETYTPADIAALKGGKQPRPQFIALAGTLGSFNEGLIGPGHCDEDSLSLV